MARKTKNLRMEKQDSLQDFIFIADFNRNLL